VPERPTKHRPSDRPADIDRRPLERRSPAVRDAHFRSGGFFDARDVTQVKYEMLRRHVVDGLSVTQVAQLFGVSRQTFYKIARDFEVHGLVGLSSQKPKAKTGPRGGWKCTAEVVAFAARRKAQRPALPLTDLSREVERRFRVSVSASALRYALAKAG
jgi:transposase